MACSPSMAQDRPVQLLEAPVAPPDSVQVHITAPADPMQIEEDTKPQVCMTDRSERNASSFMDGISTESSVAQDDDVQIIFSAPRRRKKRRRKLESTLSASPLSQVCGPTADAFESPKIHHVVLQEATRRRSISVVQRSESCKLREEISPTCRAGSLPTIPRAVNSSVTDVQYPWFADSSYDGSPTAQFPPLTDYSAWWDQSLPTLQPRPLRTISWQPLQRDKSDSRKRKLDDAFEASPVPSSSQFCNSLQASPRTFPMPVKITPNSRLCPIHTNQYKIYGPCQHFAPPISWPIERHGMQCAGHDHHGPSVISQASVQMDSQNRHFTMSRDSLVSDSRIGNRGGEAMLQYGDQMISAEPLNQNRIPTSQLHQPSRSEEQPQQVRSLQPPSYFHTPPHPSGVLSNINSSQMPSPIAASRPAIQPNVCTTAVPIPTRRDPQVTQSLDMIRKPSLYSIPPWPSHSPAATPVHSAIAQSHIRPEIAWNSDAITTTSASRYTGAECSSRTTTEARVQSASTQPTKAATQYPSPAHDNPTNFQIPKARSSHKHSPNLIIDIAETCQELFPFAEVAARHGTQIQEVYDAFSAIIQLPLLRNADDRRRHGSLGKRRVKEYRDAKRAMERAMEGEKKGRRV